jgi:type IV pilus assembly protein PilB
MAEQERKMRVGDILIEEGIISQEQLDEALEYQKAEESPLPLGEVCINLKFISRADLRKLLRKYQANIQMGELLVNMGLIDGEQLEEALQHKEITGEKLGTVLIELEYLTEAELVEAVSIQLGFPKILPTMALIDKALLKGLSASFLKKNKSLPAFKEGDVLTIIMADPLDNETIELLRRHFKCEIEPAVATTEEIINAISMYFKNVEFGASEETKDLVIGDVVLSGKGDDSVVEVVNFIITNAIIEEASDIHIEPQESKVRVRYRVDGILQHKTDLPVSLQAPLAARIKVLCKLDIAEKRRHQDGRIEARVMNKEIDLRVSVYASMWGESVVIRVLSRSNATDLNALGFTPRHLSMFKTILDRPSGIILVTGPTGSGKTTTLYSSIAYLSEQNKKVITAEDPIEYTIDGITQGQLEKKLDLTYNDFLKAMLRQDPDVLMIGEVRDNVAAAAVVEAALTGHKVLTTFHTDDTTGALLRLLDMGIETFLISSTVVSVLAQRLVRALCPKCKRPYEPDTQILNQFKLVSFDPGELVFYEPKGCHYCKYTGYKGRIAIHEILALNDAVRDAILQRQTSHQIRGAARQEGYLISMREDGFYKVVQGVTSLEEVVRITSRNEVDELTVRQWDDLKFMCEEEIE